MLIKEQGMEGQRAKRTCVPYYKLEGPPPRCPIHGTIMYVHTTDNNDDGSRTQYRKCDVEGCTADHIKNVIPAGSSVLK